MNIEGIIVNHIDWIHSKARLFFKNPVDAEDLAGETIYKCLYSKDRFDNNRGFKPWALTIMINTYIKLYNRRKSVLFTEIEPHCRHLYYNSDSDHLAIVNNIRSIIAGCRCKSVSIDCVILYAMGYSYDEISIKRGLNIGTVKSRIALGRKLLRKSLS